ncbi:MAG: DUF2723 domain-containing protein [bacterium]
MKRAISGKGKQKIESSRQKKRKQWRFVFKFPKFLIPKDEPIVPRAFTPIDYAGGILVFFICWAVYLHTLIPTIGFHDSGDMVTAAFVLGIPHPTGYPLYCLLGKLWMTILPIGNIAYRMNLASALSASLACMMVYFIILKVGSKNMSTEHGAKSMEQKTPGSKLQAQCLLLSRISSLVPAAVSALMLAFATTFWEQAVIAEKYTLNALFATLLIFILLKWAEAMSLEHGAKSLEQKAQSSRLKAQSYLYLFAFTLGLSFTHHIQTIYLVPASIFFIVAVYWKKWMQQKQSFYSLVSTLSPLLLKMLCLFILPLFLYLYLPIRASAHPPVNWGDPETLGRFIEHITAKWYRNHYLVSNIDFSRIYEHINSFFIPEFFLFGLGIIGLFILFKNKRIIFSIFLFLIILTNIFNSIRYTIGNIQDYYIPCFIIFSILSGYSIIEITKVVLGITRKIEKSKISLYIFLTIFLFIPIISLDKHYYYNNKRLYYYAYDYGINILKPLQGNAIIFPKYDEDSFLIWYLHWAEKVASNLVIIPIADLENDYFIQILKEKYPHVVSSSITQNHQVSNVIKRFNNIVNHNIKNYSIYVNQGESIVMNNYLLIPEGSFARILEKNITKKAICRLLENNGVKLTYRDNNRIFRDSKALLMMENYAASYNNRSCKYLDIGKYDKAIIEAEKAIEVKPDFIDAHCTLAVIYKEKGEYNKAIKKVKEILKINPYYVNAHILLGSIFEIQGKIFNAIKEYKIIMKIYSKDMTIHKEEIICIHNILCRLYIKIERIDRAINECKKILEIIPDDFKTHQNLAGLYYKRGQFKESALEFREVIKLDSNNLYAKEMLDELNKIIKKDGG